MIVNKEAIHKCYISTIYHNIHHKCLDYIYLCFKKPAFTAYQKHLSIHKNLRKMHLQYRTCGEQGISTLNNLLYNIILFITVTPNAQHKPEF